MTHPELLKLLEDAAELVENIARRDELLDREIELAARLRAAREELGKATPTYTLTTKRREGTAASEGWIYDEREVVEAIAALLMNVAVPVQVTVQKMEEAK